MNQPHRSQALGWTIALAVILAAVVNDYQFLPLTEFGDGFALQLAAAGTLVSEGVSSGLLDDSWLPVLHIVRLAAVAPFLAIEELTGPAGPVALLLLLLWPLTRVPGSAERSLLTLVPLVLPVLVSGRGALVAVGVGYVVMHLLERRRPWMLWVGAFLANLSSASVLMALVVLAVGQSSSRRASMPLGGAIQRAQVFALLLASFVLSAMDKLTGFGAGATGYESHAFDSGNVLLQVLSRSTLAVSIVEGQYLRALAYGTIAALLLIKLVSAFSDPRQRTARRIVLCCAPGILMEGLGALAMIFPLIWLLRGFPSSEARMPALAIPRRS